MYKNIEANKCDPPGTFRETIPHPGGGEQTIEKAIIMEHRFAFFFWMKWRNLLHNENELQQSTPTLVTIDWHRDLAPTSDEMEDQLLELDQSNLSDVANFVWAKFDQTNDGHIHCATWLNLIGDVIFLKNTGQYQEDTVNDHQGNEHRVYEFREFEQFQDFMLGRSDQNIILDIDLDYFIHGKGNRFYSDDFRRFTDDEIKQIINPQKEIFKHILPKTEGLTIALEPGYCGGISNACKIMDIVNSQLFDDQNEWRHSI